MTVGRASDGRVARKVAENVLKSGALDEATADAAIKAIKTTSDTPAQIVRDVAPILKENTAYFGRRRTLTPQTTLVTQWGCTGVSYILCD